MTSTITAFESSPDRGKGLARDMRVRWALEEVGQPYEVRLLSFQAMKEPAHLALHPFGQIPTYEEGDLALFETGAIVLHIAERHAGLLPPDAGDGGNARARAITWMFAALSTVEPPILEFANARLLESDKPWSKERLPLVADRVRARLKQLAREKFYDNVPFHRVMDGFMAQTGDGQNFNGTGGSKYPNLKQEFSSVQFKRGIVGMARRGDSVDSANSQFFIMFADGSSLNNQYTVIGEVVQGMDVVDKLKKAPPGSQGGTVTDPDKMTRVQVAADAK